MLTPFLTGEAGSHIDDRTIHEIYSQRFLKSIMAGVDSIMCSCSGFSFHFVKFFSFCRFYVNSLVLSILTRFPIDLECMHVKMRGSWTTLSSANLSSKDANIALYLWA